MTGQPTDRRDPSTRPAPILLGLETSCDETAAAIVGADKRIYADLVLSQIDDHRPFGGVVPEIAARSHLQHLDRLIGRALAEADMTLAEIDAIAATTGPGLVGGLLVGATMGKAIALAAGKPFLAINHLEAHALSARLVADLEFPYLLLLISGGHCQLLEVKGVGSYRRLGTTLDDAAGECFDKCAKLLGLGFPGGPAIERAAARAHQAGVDDKRFDLPRPMLGKPGADFSFSGLKTAVAQQAQRLQEGGMNEAAADALAHALQERIAGALVERTQRALAMASGASALVVAGGVAANRRIKTALEALASAHGLKLIAPPPNLCTDNAAMIAWAGIERFSRGECDGLDAPARPRWPLDPSAPKAIGAGVKA